MLSPCSVSKDQDIRHRSRLYFFFGHIFLGDLEVDGEVIITTQTVTVSKDQILPQTMAGGPAMEAQETGR